MRLTLCLTHSLPDLGPSSPSSYRGLVALQRENECGAHSQYVQERPLCFLFFLFALKLFVLVKMEINFIAQSSGGEQTFDLPRAVRNVKWLPHQEESHERLIGVSPVRKSAVASPQTPTSTGDAGGPSAAPP